MAAHDHDDTAPSRSLAPPGPARAREHGFLVRLPQTPLVLPETCASCGLPATRRVRIEDGKSTTLLLGYCEACADAREQRLTRRIASALGALLVASALAAALPIAFPFQSVWLGAPIVFLGGLVPLCIGWLFGRLRPLPGQGRDAAWFRAPSELVCRNRAFARELAARAGTEAEELALARRELPLTLPLLALVALIAAPASHAFHHPRVRVLALTPRPFELSVDGRWFGRVEPSSSESPAAGKDLRVPAGSRELLAVDVDGELVARVRVDVHAGKQHLFAPAAPQICFWLETTGYGREKADTDVVPLDSAARFWVIPSDVRGWFVPAPPPESSGASGGRTTVLRQGACRRAPEQH